VAKENVGIIPEVNSALFMAALSIEEAKHIEGPGFIVEATTAQ